MTDVDHLVVHRPNGHRLPPGSLFAPRLYEEIQHLRLMADELQKAFYPDKISSTTPTPTTTTTPMPAAPVEAATPNPTYASAAKAAIPPAPGETGTDTLQKFQTTRKFRTEQGYMNLDNAAQKDGLGLSNSFAATDSMRPGIRETFLVSAARERVDSLFRALFPFKKTTDLITHPRIDYLAIVTHDSWVGHLELKLTNGQYTGKLCFSPS
ncbi:hypothetical protein B0H11DRAFT_2232061 [Mycena galericulata]|nr:hypothetical protein B0H11DRAFT_2232061 [Mycena galericulata]